MADEILGITGHINLDDMFNGVEALIKKLGETTAHVDKLKKELKELADSGASAEVLAKKVEELGDAQRKAAADAYTAYEANKKYRNDLIKGGEDATEALKNEEKLTLAYREASEGAKEADEALKRLNETLGNTGTTSNTASSGLNNVSSGVSSFTDKIKGAKDAVVGWATGHGKLSEGLNQFKNGLDKLPIPLKTATEGVGDMVKGLWAMCKTPIGAVLAAITLAIQTLFQWFTKSAEGQKKFAQITGYVSSILSSLGDIAVKVGKYLFNAFASSNGAMNSFAKGLVTTFKSAVTSAVNLITGLGKGVKGLYQILTGDFKDGWETLKSAGHDMGTAISSAIDTIGNSVKATGDMIKGAVKMARDGISTLNNTDVMGAVNKMNQKAKESAQLQLRQKENEIAISEAKKKEAELDAKIAESREKIYTLSGKERLAEIERLKTMQKEKYDERIKQYQEAYDIQKRTNELHSSTLEDEEKERQLNIQLLQLKAQQAAATRMTTRLEESTKKTMLNEGKKGAKMDAATAAAQGKLDELLYTQEQARVKAEEDMEKRIADARIDAMKEGYAKTKALRELQNKEELQTIQRQKEAALESERKRQKAVFEAEQAVVKAKGGKVKQWDNSMFDENDEAVKKIKAQYGELTEEVLKKQERLNKNFVSQQQQSMRDYLKEYGTFQQQKLAIAEEYADKIEKAQGDEFAVKRLQRQLEEEYRKIDIQALSEQIDWSLAFDGFADAFQGEVKQTLDSIEEYMKSKDFASESASNKAEIIKLRESLIGKTGSDTGFFELGTLASKVGDQLKKYQASMLASMKAEQELYTATQELLQAKKEHEDAESRAAKETATEADKKAAENAKKKYEEKQEKFSTAEKNKDIAKGDLAVAKSDLQKSVTDVKKSIDDFGSALSQITSGTLRGFADGLINLYNAISGNGLSNGLAGLGTLFSGMKKKTHNIGSEASDAIGSVSKAINSTKDLAKHVTEGTQEVEQESDNAASGAIAAITTAAAGSGNVWGMIVGAILDLIDALGDDPAAFVDDLLTKIINVINGLFEQAFSGELAGAIAKGISQMFATLLKNIIEMANPAAIVKSSINNIGSIFSGFGEGIASAFGNDNHEEQLEIQEEANRQLEMINDRVGRISDKLEKSYGVEAKKTYDELMEFIKQSQTQYNVGLQAAGNDRYGGGHAEWWHRNKNGGEGEGGYVDRIKKAYNLNFNGTAWQDLFNYLASLPENAGAEILDKLRNDSSMIDIWNELMRTNSYDEGAIAKWVEEWANSYEDIENAKKELAERLTTTTEEDVFDDFLNSLYDFADGADDVMDNIAENWQKMVNRMVISNIMGTELQAWIADWYKELADLQEGYNSGNITPEEYQRRLNSLYSAYEEEMKRRQGQVETLTEAGIIKPLDEANEKLKDIFDNIESSFRSLISETEPDMEEWGKNVKNSIIENLLEAMVFGEEFKTWMKQLTEEFNKIWEQYENDKDENMLAAALAGLDEQIDAKGDEIAAIIKKLKETLGYSLSGEEGDNPFSGLRDSFLDTLTNMEDDAEAFRKRLTEIMVQDMIDKNVLGTAFKMDEYFDLDSGEKIEKVFENFDKYLEDWNERYKNAVESGNQDLIDALIDELVRAREITIEAAEQWRDKIKEVTKDTTFSDMSDSWVSTLMDMSKTAEDWAENVGKIMAEQIIKQMIVPTYIQPLLDELQDVFNKVMEDATSTDDNGKKVYDWESVIGSEELQAQLEIMKKKFPELQAIIKQIMDSLGLDTSNYKYSGFSNLGDSILESLKSSEGSLENWAKSMGQQMAEDMAKAYIDATYGKDIDDLNKAWQKALQEGDTAAMKDIEDQLSALYGRMADDPELQRLIDKFRELAENPFKDMASDFASSLMDMEQSAEDFANNIAKSLTQEMITKVIKDQYQSQIDALGEQWKAALEAGDSAAIERIRQQLEALYEKMGESVKPLLDAIKDIGKETDTTFTGMKDSWVSALMDMEGTAEDFAQTVGRTMAQKIITELVAPTYIEPILKRMQDAYNLAIAESGATFGSVLKKMTPFLSEIEGIYNEIQPIIQEIFGTIGIVADSVEEAAEEVEYALGDMKSNFVSALMDMTNSAEDFSKDISKIMAQTFIEKFVLGEQFDRQMEYWQQQYESIIGSGMSEDERKRQLKALRDTIVAAKEGYVNEAMAIQELFGLTTEDNQTATMNMADKITYDQADQLLGINLAQELTLEQILATLQGKDIVSVGGSGMTWQSASGAQNDEQSRLINATLTNFAQMTQMNHDNILTQVAMANSHLQMIRDYSKKICDQVELHMESMDDKLSHLRNW